MSYLILLLLFAGAMIVVLVMVLVVRSLRQSSDIPDLQIPAPPQPPQAPAFEQAASQENKMIGGAAVSPLRNLAKTLRLQPLWARLMWAVFTAAFLFSGLYFFWQGVQDFNEALDSRTWPSIQGRVMTARVAQETDDEGSTMYSADIHYTYAVSRRPYIGTRVSVSDYSSSNYDRASQIIARYPPGSTIPVYYNPATPANSALEPGLNGGLWLPLGVGGLFALIGLADTAFTFWVIFSGRRT